MKMDVGGFMVHLLEAFQLVTTTPLTLKKDGGQPSSSPPEVTDKKRNRNQRISWTKKILGLLELHHKFSERKMIMEKAMYPGNV